MYHHTSIYPVFISHSSIYPFINTCIYPSVHVYPLYWFIYPYMYLSILYISVHVIHILFYLYIIYSSSIHLSVYPFFIYPYIHFFSLQLYSITNSFRNILFSQYPTGPRPQVQPTSSPHIWFVSRWRYVFGTFI